MQTDFVIPISFLVHRSLYIFPKYLVVLTQGIQFCYKSNYGNRCFYFLHLTSTYVHYMVSVYRKNMLALQHFLTQPITQK